MHFTIIISAILCVNLTIALRPNILLIIVDDLRPALGIYNDSNAYTPNIDNLGKSSFVFKNAFAQQALCAPSRNSFLTSRRPDTLHLYDFYNYWRHFVGNFTTLPQHFKENGYTTHSIGKVFHPGISSNFTDDYPYSWSLKPFHPVTQKYKNSKVCIDAKGNKGTNYVCPVRVADQPGGTLPDIECLQEAKKFLKNARNSLKPYFLSVGFQKPHIPLKFPQFHPLDEVKIPINIIRPPMMPTVAWNPWNDLRERDDIKNLDIPFPFGVMPVEYLSLIIQSYAAAVSYVDDLIGQLLQEVNLDNTIVVLLGDHGVSLGEHGEFSKYSNFDVATKVPLIFHVPNLSPKGKVSTEMVQLLDLFPTLVDLSAVSKSLEKCKCNKKNQKLCTEGRSLVNHMVDLVQKENCEKSDAVAISQYPRPQVYPEEKPNSDKPKLKEIKIMGYSLRSPDFRYTEWIGFNHLDFSRNWSNVYAKELYLHKIDPQEYLNLALRPEMNHIMNDLHKQLVEALN